MNGPFQFDQDRRRHADAILARMPEKRAALLPLLWLVQEQEGWVPPAAAEEVARLAGMTAAEVHEALSFYAMFECRPPARHRLQVCEGICCQLRGTAGVVERLRSKLGIDVGARTADGRIALSTVQCLGACDRAPAMLADGELCEGLDEAGIDALVEKLVR
jgi:NADH-quinone oxidoreductase E subunit